MTSATATTWVTRTSGEVRASGTGPDGSTAAAVQPSAAKPTPDQPAGSLRAS